MKVIVDLDVCEGNAKCVEAAPEVFKLGDDDKAIVLNETPGPELRAKLQRAVRTCPKQAIKLVE
jgi:ferredoxin